MRIDAREAHSTTPSSSNIFPQSDGPVKRTRAVKSNVVDTAHLSGKLQIYTGKETDF